MLKIIIGMIIAYGYSLLFLPNKEYLEPKINPTIYPLLYKGMFIIPYNNLYAIHLHHWVLCYIILIISLFVYIPRIIIGFVIGLFIQGIIYKDCFQFICNNPYMNINCKTIR